MIYLLTSEMTAPTDKVAPHLEDHFAYLDRYHQAGTFLASGVTPHGAVIVAQGDDLTAMELIVAEDPLIEHGVVACTITAMNPGRVHPALAGPLGVSQDKIRG